MKRPFHALQMRFPPTEPNYAKSLKFMDLQKIREKCLFLWRFYPTFSNLIGSMSSNSVHVLNPYKVKTQSGHFWAFDDARFGLSQEPFVGETNHVIDFALATKGMTGDRFTFMCSGSPLPDADTEFDLDTIEGESQWYISNPTDGSPRVRFWLCPAMRHYFPSPPRKLYIKLLA